MSPCSGSDAPRVSHTLPHSASDSSRQACPPWGHPPPYAQALTPPVHEPLWLCYTRHGREDRTAHRGSTTRVNNFFRKSFPICFCFLSPTEAPIVSISQSEIPQKAVDKETKSFLKEYATYINVETKHPALKKKKYFFTFSISCSNSLILWPQPQNRYQVPGLLVNSWTLHFLKMVVSDARGAKLTLSFKTEKWRYFVIQLDLCKITLDNQFTETKRWRGDRKQSSKGLQTVPGEHSFPRTEIPKSASKPFRDVN